MKFEDIWLQLVRKEPALADPTSKLEFTSDNLRKLLRQVYEQGHKMGEEEAKASPADPPDLYSQLFGGRR